MPIEITIPKISLTMTEALIVEWKKGEGDQIKKGEILFILETEKVTYEVEAPEDGVLGKIVAMENETVPVGEIVAYLLKPNESIMELEAALERRKDLPGKVEKTSAEPSQLENGASLKQAASVTGSRTKASPLARKTATMYKIDLRLVKGTGSGGMITKEDVERVNREKEKDAPFPSTQTKEVLAKKVLPFTGMRRTIAKKMLASKNETAQTYMSVDVDAYRIVEYRKEMLPAIQKESGVRITITDIIMKITSLAIAKHPIMNTRWADEGILFFGNIHMGMAMALDDGLIVPVIRDIGQKTLAQISNERLELIQKGKEKRFLPDDITGSTFTVSSLGMFGIDRFTANINLPENAILAVGAILDKPAVVDGEVVIRPAMNVTLSYDHRTIDGAEAGKFMRTLKTLLENPLPAMKGEPATSVTEKKKKITVIGGGVGGYSAAIKAARLGADVTLIEKNLVGGVCLNWGCVPTKALLQSCGVIKGIEDSKEFGIDCGDTKFDIRAIMDRKNSVVTRLRNGVEKLLSAKQIRVIKGTASIVDPSTVQIEENQETIQSDKIIIATGSTPQRLNVKGSDGSNVWYSDDLFEMKVIPKSVAIIGGGIIGVEYAQILRRLGVDVTIIEMMKDLIPGMDTEIASALKSRFIEDEIKVHTDSRVNEIRQNVSDITVAFRCENRDINCTVERVIICVGRRPDLSWLDLDRIGLAKKNGALLVNSRMETNIPSIYAVGDVTGGMMLAHVAISEGECAARNAMGGDVQMSYHAIPSCIYTSPEVGSVGLTEEEAKQAFHIEVGRFPFHGSGKALILNKTYGMVKIVTEKGSGKVLGVHIIGPNATELIGEAVLCLSQGGTVEEVAYAVHPHPSLSEAIMECALSLCGGAIHMP